MPFSVNIDPIILSAICCVVSFALCGIPFGKIITKLMVNVDLQDVGSGNIGTTNALRAGGPKVAILTLICDVLKGFICVRASIILILSACLSTSTYSVSDFNYGGAYDFIIALICLFCVLGHMFSPYLGFKGGKSIAVGVGVLFGFSWPLALLHLGIFIVLVALTRYVSIGSITTAALVGVTVWMVFPQASLTFKLIMAALGLCIVWAHRTNIKKLLRGTESKLSFSKRVTRRDDD